MSEDDFYTLVGKTNNPKLFKLGDIEFIDAQSMHQQHPDTFESPTVAELSEIDVGDTVKVCDGEERFWTVVTEITTSATADIDTVVTAEVNNKLVGGQPYNLGDLIQFEPRHIYQIKTKRENEVMGQMLAYCMEKCPGSSIPQLYEMIEVLMANGITLDLLKAHENHENAGDDEEDQENVVNNLE